MKKILLVLAYALSLTLTSIACGTKPGNGGAAGKSLYEQIKATGTLRIGTEGTYAPFTFHDKDGKLTGFDVEIGSEVARRLGVKAEYIEAPWDGMFAGLDAGRFDMIANEVGIRPDRQAKYDFSEPYGVSKAVLIVHKDNADIRSFADLKGKKAAQSLTANLTEIARSNGAEIIGVEGFNQSIDLLLSRRVDATVNDSMSFLDLMKQKPDLPLKKTAEQAEAIKNGLMFRKGSKELVDAVNLALAGMRSDGAYLKISEKYFGADVSR